MEILPGIIFIQSAFGLEFCVRHNTPGEKCTTSWGQKSLPTCSCDISNLIEADSITKEDLKSMKRHLKAIECLPPRLPKREPFPIVAGVPVLAQWKDGRFYPATVIRPVPKAAVVEFRDYPGEEVEVL
jgi:hypothetical protein